MSTETKGILLRLLSVALFVAMAGCVHGAAKTASIGQIVFFRSFLSIPALMIYGLMSTPLSDFVPRAPKVHLIRGTLGGITMLLNFTALANLPVANASALTYLAPILTLPVAVVFLGERLSRRVIFAVSLGFAGVITMLYSSFVDPNWGWQQVLGIAAGFGAAAMMALMRVQLKHMTRSEPLPAISLSFALIASAIGLASLLIGPWHAMTPSLWGWLIAAGLIGGLAQITAIEAVARAPVSTLAPLEYSGLIWAVLFDILVFATLPTFWAYVGMALITGAALMVALLPRTPRPPDPTAPPR